LFKIYVYENNTTILDPWYRIKNKVDTNLNDDGDILAFYLDENENVIAKTGFELSTKIGHFDDYSGDGIFSLRIPDIIGTKKIVLQRNGETIAERVFSPNPPTITILSPKGGETFVHGDIINVIWEAFDPDGDELFYSISYSRDGGLVYIPLTIDYSDTNYSFEAQPNVVSDSIVIRVTVSDGINTSMDYSDKFSIVSPNI